MYTQAFIDRDPKYFLLILNWLRDPAAPFTPPEDLQGVFVFYMCIFVSIIFFQMIISTVLIHGYTRFYTRIGLLWY